ncbi:MAG: NUDIX domain-containing protein [Flavobacteriales bacterium]|nr:NUDIX domain-containing protein [Flavobacteriales bacterium]
MAQKYKVYFLNRPVVFTDALPDGVAGATGIEVFHSRGTHDTGHIETAISRGARSIFILCNDVRESWERFSEQFEFVQSAGGLVLNHERKMLFIFRHDRWDLPKGKVEENESVEEGALREVEEECSLFELEIVSPLCETWHTYMQAGLPVLKCTSWFMMNHLGNEQPVPQAIEGITETRWLDWSELDEVRSNTYPSVLDVVEEYAVAAGVNSL